MPKKKQTRPPTGGALRAVIYPRVSSAIQRDAHTIENQLRELPRCIERNGWTLVKPAGTYADDGRSAKAGQLEKRTGWARLIRDAQAGMFDIVAVVAFDRLTRSEDIGERGQILGDLQRAGVSVFDASSGQLLDLSSSAGDMFSGLLTFFAVEDNRRRAEKARAGAARAIEAGRKPRGVVPFGYAWDPAGFSVHPQRGPIVREIFNRIVTGDSCAVIATDLRKRGVLSSRGKPMTNWAVWNIVRSTSYMGRWVVNKDENAALAVPPIITAHDFAVAQTALRNQRLTGLRRTKHEYLLEGAMVCEACGTLVRCLTSTKRGGKKLAQYRCGRSWPRWIAGMTVPDMERCPMPPRRVDETDAAIWEALKEQLLSTDLMERMLARRAELAKADKGTHAQDEQDAQAKLRKLDDATRRVLERNRQGLLTDAMFDEELAQLHRERTWLERQVATARRGAKEAATVGDTSLALHKGLANVRKHLPRMKSIADRRTLLLAVLAGTKIKMGLDGLAGTSHYGMDGAIGAGFRSHEPMPFVPSDVITLPLVA